MSQPGEALCWIGFLLLVINAVVRAMVTPDPFPHWDVSPFIFSVPPTGIGPTGTLVMDVVAILGAGVALAGVALIRARVSTLQVALLTTGAAGVLLHATVLPDASLDHLTQGAPWIAALASGVGMAHLAQLPRFRALAIALCAGFIATLLAKGLIQVLVEHPETVRSYRSGRDAFLEARGWTPDSAMARNYERRLTQPEATGWFGLSNVYASFCAAGVVTLVGLAIAAWRSRRRTDADSWVPTIMTLGAVASLAALGLAKSKGGAGAALLGLGVLVILFVLSRRRPGTRRDALARATAIGAPALVLVLIGARALIGERLGELSLLFRAFYAEGAARIWMSEPLFGVGPAGFKDAYLLAKPPISPEEVTSPHSVAFDWTATLGVLGLAWVGLLILWLGASAIRALAPAPTPPDTARTDLRVILLVTCASSAVSAWIEGAMATPEGGAMRVAAIVGWSAVAVAILRSFRATPAALAIAGAAGAVTLVAHFQIEVTPVWTASCTLAMVWLGATAPISPAKGPERPKPARALLSLAPLALAIAILGLGLAPVATWEHNLAVAARGARPVAVFQERLDALARNATAPTHPGDTPQALATDLALATGRPPAGSTDELMAQLMALRESTLEQAAERLERAVAARADHLPTRVALTRLYLSRADAAPGDDPNARARALEVARAGTVAHPRSSQAWGWLGTVLNIAGTAGDPNAQADAVAAWETAASLDPHGMVFPLRLFEAARRTGNDEQARRWADALLALDRQMRLDPLKGLTDRERARVRRVVQP